jgi:HK97 family phage prohead protease
MPFEFQRRIDELLREGESLDAATSVAFAEMERRYAQAREAQEKLTEGIKGEQERLRGEEKGEREREREHEKEIAEIKKPAPRLAASAPEKRAFCAASVSGAITFTTIHSAKREIEGYASVFGEPMRSHEVMGAAPFPQATIDEFMTNPVMLFNHNTDRVVGKVVELRQDAYGLWCRAQIEDDEIWNQIEDGRLRAFSWAGYIVRYHFVPDTKAMLGAGNGEFLEDAPVAMMIDEGELTEISIVSIPNCSRALFEIRKAMSGEDTLSLWAPVSRVDANEREVYGYAVVFNEPDADGHVITKEAVQQAVDAYQRWSNIREMHDPVAVGTAFQLKVDDFGLWVGVKISLGAENCWQKVLDRTYRGFSIGGVALSWQPGELDGRSVLFLTEIRIDEISICDRPKAAKATFALVKRQGAPGAPRGGNPLETNEQMTDTTEERRLSIFQTILNSLGGRKPEAETAVAATTNSVSTTEATFITPPQTISQPAVLTFQSAPAPAATEARVAELIETANAAMRKDVETAFNTLLEQLTAQISALKALPEAEKVEVPAPIAAAAPNALAEAMTRHMAAGLDRVDAFNAAAGEVADGEAEKVLDALGLPTAQNAPAPTAPDATVQLATAVQALAAQVETLKVQSTRQSVHTDRRAAAVTNTPTTAEDGKGFWSSCFRKG